MKIYRYQAMSVSGNTDPYIVFNRLFKEYQNIKYFNPTNPRFHGRKEDPFHHPLDGIKINKLFSGSTVADLKNDGSECHIQLDANIELISDRSILLVEFVFNFKNSESFDIFYNYIDQNSIMTQKIFKWIQNEQDIECSISSIMNNFLTKKIYPIATDVELQKAYDDYDPTENYSIVKWKNKLNEVIGITPDICGSRSIMNNQHKVSTDIIFDDCNFFDINDNFKECSDKYSIYISKKNDDYICINEKELNKFIRDYKNYHIFDFILMGYNISCYLWSDSIKKEADDLVFNLEDSSDSFWSDLRLKIEEWQLHFISQNAIRAQSLSMINSVNFLTYKSINRQTAKKWLNKLNEKQNKLEKFIDEIKYNLDNISIPGHVHGEQALQKISETTNERILFLSFLAMSIPMLGAILSPDITLQIKIISALVLLSLPVIYFATTKISKLRTGKIDKIKNYKRQKKHLEQFISHHKDNINETKNNDFLADDIKEEIINMEQNIIDMRYKHLDKLNKKIK